MSPELEKAILEILSGAKHQAPEAVAEVLRWGWIEAWIAIGLGLAAGAVAAGLIARARTRKGTWDDNGEYYICAAMFVLIAGLLGFMGAAQALQLTYAPTAYLLGLL